MDTIEQHLESAMLGGQQTDPPAQAEIPLTTEEPTEQTVETAAISTEETVPVIKPETPPEMTASPPETPDKLLAPSHWPQEQQARFNGLPKEGQEVLLEQSKWLEAGATKKFEQAADMRREISEQLANLAKGQQPEVQEEPEQPPDDPIERIQWDTEKAVMARVNKRLNDERAEGQKTSMANRAAEIKANVQRDPLKDSVAQALISWVELQPDVIDPTDSQRRTFRRIEYDRLDRNPDYYAAKYSQARGMIVSSMENNKPAQEVTQTPTQTRTQHAPVLEGGGGNSPEVNAKAKQDAKLDGVLKQIRAGKAKPGTISDLLNALPINF